MVMVKPWGTGKSKARHLCQVGALAAEEILGVHVPLGEVKDVAHLTTPLSDSCSTVSGSAAA